MEMEILTFFFSILWSSNYEACFLNFQTECGNIVHCHQLNFTSSFACWPQSILSCIQHLPTWYQKNPAFSLFPFGPCSNQMLKDKHDVPTSWNEIYKEFFWHLHIKLERLISLCGKDTQRPFFHHPPFSIPKDDWRNHIDINRESSKNVDPCIFFFTWSI